MVLQQMQTVYMQVVRCSCAMHAPLVGLGQHSSQEAKERSSTTFTMQAMLAAQLCWSSAVQAEQALDSSDSICLIGGVAIGRIRQ